MKPKFSKAALMPVAVARRIAASPSVNPAKSMTGIFSPESNSTATFDISDSPLSNRRSPAATFDCRNEFVVISGPITSHTVPNKCEKPRAQGTKMKPILACVAALFCILAASSLAGAQPVNNVILGYSGGGSTGALRRIIERDKLWEKYGLNVKSVYFGSGGVLTQALVGGNIVGSDSEIPAMLNLSIA